MLRTKLHQRTAMLIMLSMAAFPSALPLVYGQTAEQNQPKPMELIRIAARELVKMQKANGQWPFELAGAEEACRKSTDMQIASTSIVAEALLLAAPSDAEARAAVQRGIAFVIKNLDDTPAAKPVPFRMWGHLYALDFLCHVRAGKMGGDQKKEVEEWISRLVKSLIREEIPTGGWNYGLFAGKGTVQAPVTYPAAQAMLLAHSQGEKVPDALLQRTRKLLENARIGKNQGDFQYPLSKDFATASLWLACETTLTLFGGGSADIIQSALDNFYKHWNELEKTRSRKGKEGTHESHCFCYGHRYAAQAIELLPQEKRAKERQRLLTKILETRDADGTWQDMGPGTRPYGTAMMVLALLGEQTPMPPRLAK